MKGRAKACGCAGRNRMLTASHGHRPTPRFAHRPPDPLFGRDRPPLAHRAGPGEGLRLLRSRALQLGVCPVVPGDRGNRARRGQGAWTGRGSWPSAPIAAERWRSRSRYCCRCDGARSARGLAGRMTTGRFWSPDPVQVYGDGYVLRRLAANRRMVDFAEMPAKGREQLIRATGQDRTSVPGRTMRIRTRLRRS